MREPLASKLDQDLITSLRGVQPSGRVSSSGPLAPMYNEYPRCSVHRVDLFPKIIEDEYAYRRREVAGVPGSVDLFHKHGYARVIVVGNFMQALPKFVF